jgi:hypothetical protein
MVNFRPPSRPEPDSANTIATQTNLERQTNIGTQTAEQPPLHNQVTQTSASNVSDSQTQTPPIEPEAQRVTFENQTVSINEIALSVDYNFVSRDSCFFLPLACLQNLRSISVLVFKNKGLLKRKQLWCRPLTGAVEA